MELKTKKMNYFSRPALDYQKPKINDIIERVCSHFELPISQLYIKRNLREVVEVRSIVMYLLHRYLGITSTEVARIFDKNHATVLHNCNKVQGFMDIDKEYKILVNKFK